MYPKIPDGAGVDVIPVMAKLHGLVADVSPRQVWWIYGARNGRDHPFAREARALVAKLPDARAPGRTL